VKVAVLLKIIRLVTLEIEDNLGAISTQSAIVTVSSPPANEEPIAGYSYTCTDLSCVFDATQSSDPDGSIVAYRWDFGEGEASESGGPVKNHSFTLEIEDNLGAISTQSTIVTVTVVVQPDPTDIQLSVAGNKYRRHKWAELTWSDASGSEVHIFRDGNMLTTVTNDGNFNDRAVSKKTKSAVYQICESESSNCSEEISVKF